MDQLTDALQAAGRARPDAEAQQAAARFAAGASDEVDLAYTDIDSPIGSLLGVASRRGLLALLFHRGDEDEMLDRIASRVSPRILEAPVRLDPVRRELDEYFAGQRRQFDVPLDWTLTRGFGRKVLEITNRIPYGSTSTYRVVAGQAGSPRGARAAGNALGANPIPVIVPCHRVLHTTGGLGGYGGGLENKEFLLRLEGGWGADRLL
ncbi:MAG: methylated-DNA--[protein]-cysteine S-methyltransferase [Acidimicrobiia bacterium]